ncbi:hypothetical protein [Pararhodobacter marinus]|uniref:hypothetical protein n=1 Tax=Pararhodobacter marinus TaxID=2184063 RepID=UPI001FEA1116|nr:hypothetical protein [Pararhodobacter marinus]
MTRSAARTLSAAGVFAIALGAVFPAFAQNAAPAPQGTPMTAEEFEAHTEGRTLSYAIDGTPYGIEEYLPNRRVRWAFVNQECNDGVWYERGDAICFLYEAAPDDEQCWHFYAEGSGLRAVFQGGDGPSTELYEVEQSDQPLTCMGPGVGV